MQVLTPEASKEPIEMVTASMEVCQVACSVTFIPAEQNVTNNRDTIDKKASIRNGTVWH